MSPKHSGYMGNIYRNSRDVKIEGVPFSDAFEEKKTGPFALRAPAEETKDLIAVHNATEKNVRGLLGLGGLPMPSIAIIKAAQGHDDFGEYSFVFDKSTIDPATNRNNKVYGSDAFTVIQWVGNSVQYNQIEEITDDTYGQWVVTHAVSAGDSTDNVKQKSNAVKEIDQLHNGWKIAYSINKEANKLAPELLENLGIRLSKKYKAVIINDRQCFITPGGLIVEVVLLKPYQSVVVGYANDMEDAKKNLFEDGDMVDCSDTEDSIFMQICNEIDAEDQS